MKGSDTEAEQGVWEGVYCLPRGRKISGIKSLSSAHRWQLIKGKKYKQFTHAVALSGVFTSARVCVESQTGCRESAVFMCGGEAWGDRACTLGVSTGEWEQREKEKGGKKRKENSPSKKNTWKINKKRHINNGKSTVDSLQFNLFILWKYKGPREERKGKAYGQACTFWWAPSWLGRDARIIYTRIQTPTLTENLYSDDEALYWLECRFHQPLTLPLHSHTHTHTIQPVTHVPRNGPDLWGESKGQRTAFHALYWWRERVTTGEIKHEASGKTVREESGDEQNPLAQPRVRAHVWVRALSKLAGTERQRSAI